MFLCRCSDEELSCGQNKVYGTADPTLTYSTAAATGTTGLVNGDTLAGGISYAGAGQYTGVGNYATTLGNLSNSNYNIVREASAPTFVITPAPLSITANAQSKLYGELVPALTYSESGLVGGDTISGALATSANASSNVGTYSITRSSLSASSNYVVSFTGANLSVTPAPTPAGNAIGPVQLSPALILSSVPASVTQAFTIPARMEFVSDSSSNQLPLLIFVDPSLATPPAR